MLDWDFRLRMVFTGVLTLGSLVIALFFLRFWRGNRDGLFLCFSGAFALLALNWLLAAFIRADEAQSALYTVRLAAFALIIWGVWCKNRRGRVV
jgi:hypothetical protein